MLKKRHELKYAALDAWSAAANLLPDGIEMESISLVDGKTVSFLGKAPTDQSKALLDFETDMRRATVNGRPLFMRDKGRPVDYRIMGKGVDGKEVYSWNLGLELKRSEDK